MVFPDSLDWTSIYKVLVMVYIFFLFRVGKVFVDDERVIYYSIVGGSSRFLPKIWFKHTETCYYLLSGR